MDANTDENQSIPNLQNVEKLFSKHFKPKDYNEEVWLVDEYEFVEFISILKQENGGMELRINLSDRFWTVLETKNIEKSFQLNST